MWEFSKEDVLAKLSTVIDPELSVNIVDLGLVYEVLFDDGLLRIVMTLTTPGCPLAPVINSMVMESLESLPGFSQEKLVVDLTFDPPWTPEMIKEDIRIELGLDEWG